MKTTIARLGNALHLFAQLKRTFIMLLVLSATGQVLSDVVNGDSATWTGEGDDNLWSNAQNWSTKSVPTSATTVKFDDDATVEMGETAEIYGLIVNPGKTFTLYRTGNSAGDQNSLWATLKIGSGQVTGGGTVKLICAGISKTIGDFTIDANIEFQNNGTYDSFLEETESGTFFINGTVTGSGYLQVKTSTTFNGNVTIPAGSTIKVNSYTYNLGNSASLSGAGTLIFDGAGVQDSFKTAVQDSTKWTGTCELRSLTISNIDFADYGNENSYVGANGLSGTFKGSGVCRIADGIKGLKLTGNGLTVGDWSTEHTYVIAADISGAGPINLNIQSNAGSPLNAPASIDKVVFTGSTSDFTGQVSFKKTSYRPCYIFANESDLESLPTPTDYGQIIVMAGKTVNVGSVWTAAGGFLINGEADTKSSSAYLSGTVLGNGTVKVAYTHSSGALRVPDFGIASENTFEITGMTGGWISNAGANGMPNIKATVKLSGNVTINNGYGADDTTSNVMTFKRLTGSGNLSFSFSTQKTYVNYTISTINGAINVDNPYTGTITANNLARVVIGVVDVDEVPLDGRRLVGITNSNRGRFVNASGTAINDNGLIDVTVKGTEDTAKLYADTDGLYVAIAQVGDTYYKSLRAAADAARAADTAFTRVYAGAGDTYPGWTYSDGVFTYDNKVAYNATKDVAYATLQDAITASSAEDIIQLLEPNSETAVDTTDKDFFFDENGYAFAGTWTGSGRIVLSTFPVKTTWSSARFVSSGDPSWTGTVALDWKNIVSANDLPTQFNKYGISGSMVEIGANGSASGYLNSAPTPKLKINGSLEIKNGSSNNERTISYITGNGSLTFTRYYYGGDTTNYKVTTLEDWNGVITNTSPAVAITTIQSGAGVIYTSSGFKANPTVNDGWQGRVVLDYANIVVADTDVGAKINAYGVSGSTVEIGKNGSAQGYLNDDIKPNVKVSGTLKIKNGSSAAGNQRTIPYVTGSGNLEFMYFYNGGETTNYAITNLESWDGVLIADSSKIRITNIKSGTGTVQFDRTPQQTPVFDSAWRGTFVMNWTPTYESTPASTVWVLDNYGVSGSTVVVAQAIEHGYLKDKSSDTAPSIAPAVYLKANLTVDNGFYNATTTFSQLGADEGVVFTTRSSADGTPYAVTLLKDFAGSFNLLYGSRLTIDTIERNTLPSAGDLVVSATAQTDTSTPASFNVASTKIMVDGEDTVMPLAYSTSVAENESGLYPAVAKVGESSYCATIADAIDSIGDGDGYITPLMNTSLELTAGQSVKIDNSGTYTITVTAPDGYVLGEVAGESYTSYTTAGTISDGAATIETAGTTVTLPAEVTSLTVSVTGSAFGAIKAANVPVGSVVVKYGDYVTTGAYTITKDGTNQFSFDINETENASVTVGETAIKVKPEPAADPQMGIIVGSGDKLTLAVKTIPGLWYSMWSSTTISGGDLSGTVSKPTNPIQATSASTTVNNGQCDDGVRYYKVVAGATEADLK